MYKLICVSYVQRICVNAAFTRAISQYNDDVDDGNLVSIECPRTELHLTFLLVEREVSDVDGARTLVDGWRNPQHVAVIEDYHVRLVRYFILTISTALHTDHVTV